VFEHASEIGEVLRAVWKLAFISQMPDSSSSLRAAMRRDGDGKEFRWRHVWQPSTFSGKFMSLLSIPERPESQQRGVGALQHLLGVFWHGCICKKCESRFQNGEGWTLWERN
jgi:hypothetical protein